MGRLRDGGNGEGRGDLYTDFVVEFDNEMGDEVRWKLWGFCDRFGRRGQGREGGRTIFLVD
jgi:hypothetical protein